MKEKPIYIQNYEAEKKQKELKYSDGEIRNEIRAAMKGGDEKRALLAIAMMMYNEMVDMRWRV